MHNKICRNCGKIGHIYKNCKNPISSYGIILVDNDFGKNNYLLIQRKNSIAFNEFIFGKYMIDDFLYIKGIFSRMSKSEIQLLKERPKFKLLWDKIYKRNTVNKVLEYKYNLFISKYKDFLEKAMSFYNECEWEFPKGRRNNYETDLACACREFTEETNIDIQDIKITNKKYYEQYKSNNNNNYLHVYYLAFLKNKSLILDKEPCTEINKICWYSYSDALLKIRNYSIKKKDILKSIEKHLNTYKLF